MEVNGLQYHIRCGRGSVGRYCILPGDPGRCELIASYFDEPKRMASNREFVTYSDFSRGAGLA
jgi:uridine phosphorylase